MNLLYLLNALFIALSLPTSCQGERRQLTRDTYPSIIDDAKAFSRQNFSHIIVGGGTAGLALAARLSEVSSFRIGVIEAGTTGFDDAINSTPGFFGASIGSKYDWQYVTQTSTTGVPSIAWPRGRVLGGSSVLNFLVWDRASRAEYDAWEELGNSGWNAKTMFKYMRKAERIDTPIANKGVVPVVSSSLGRSGPVDISFPRYLSQLIQRWIPALHSLNLDVNKDPLSGNNLGAAIHPNDIDRDRGTRSSADVAYLLPNAHRTNLVVLISAIASKIEWDTQKVDGKMKAIGVTYVGKDNVRYTVQASREVISSCGSVNTPKLLEMSGIGSQPVLARAGVQQVVALTGVGENLQDHAATYVAFKLIPGIETMDTYRTNTTFQSKQLALYKAGQPSILATAPDAIGYLTLPQLYKGNSSKVQAVIQMAKDDVDGFKSPFNATVKKQLEFLIKNRDSVGQMEVIGLNGYYASTGKPDGDSTYTTLIAASQHLFSRGSVHIISNDTNVKPVITPNYFSSSFDREIQSAGTAYLRSIAATPAFANGFVQSEATPGASVTDLTAYSLQTFTSEYHPIGTASMLPLEKSGVVDAELRVHGTTNVRVVDASVIPLHISAHLQSTVYGIAEAAADILKGVAL